MASPENAVHCIQCGKPFFESPKRAPEKKVAEFSLAAGPGHAHGGVTPGGLMGRGLLLMMVIGLVVLTATAVMLRNPGTGENPGAAMTGNGEAIETGPGTPPAPTGQDAVPATINGVPNPAAYIKQADNARVTANIQRIKMAVETIYAETDAFPESLEAIPSELLGFTPDPAVYIYTPAPDKQSYQVQVKP